LTKNASLEKGDFAKIGKNQLFQDRFRCCRPIYLLCDSRYVG